MECRDGENLMQQIQDKRTGSTSSATEKRQHGKLAQLPNALENLVLRFHKLVEPLTVDFEVVWGIFYVNLRASVSF